MRSYLIARTECIARSARRGKEHEVRRLLTRSVARTRAARPGIDLIQVAVVVGITLALTTVAIPAAW